MSIDGSSPAALLRRYGLEAKRSLGQCFLHDRRVVEQIVDGLNPTHEDTVVEIGPGLGIMTAGLVDRAKMVIAIERDSQMVNVLKQEFSAIDNIKICQEDALRYDFSRLSSEPRDKVLVVGNLPYNVGTEILFRLLDHHRLFRQVSVMLQKEVAQRLAADPGSRTYGMPSVICRQLADVKWGMTVGRGCFTPVPKVESAVIHLYLREEPREKVDGRALRRVVKLAFGQRRKTLLRALRAGYPLPLVQQALSIAGIDGSRRGETLSLEEFARLTRALEAIVESNARQPDGN